MTPEEIDATDWPPIIKDKAKQILIARAEHSDRLLATAHATMLSPEKVDQLYAISLSHQKLSRLYRELGKEIAFTMAHPRR